MSTSLFDSAALANRVIAFQKTAIKLGFASPGDIDRFLFSGYGKALKQVTPADRPDSALFILEPAVGSGALPPLASLAAAIRRIRTDSAKSFLAISADLGRPIAIAHTPTASELVHCASGRWPLSHALFLSKQAGRCVIWTSGVGAVACLDGDIYIQSADTTEELAIGLPEGFQKLSWQDGEIAYEFAHSVLNETGPTGIWQLPGSHLLRPKPEKLMSLAYGRFLKQNVAGYHHHSDEPYVENQGRADIVLHIINGAIYIIEIKWIGQSLSSKKELEAKTTIAEALIKKTKGWVTVYDNKTFDEGLKQVAIYYGTKLYQRAYLTVFDCRPASAMRKNESCAVSPAFVSPHSPGNFRVHRACVDPRKASKISKSQQP